MPNPNFRKRSKCLIHQPSPQQQKCLNPAILSLLIKQSFSAENPAWIGFCEQVFNSLLSGDNKFNLAAIQTSYPASLDKHLTRSQKATFLKKTHGLFEKLFQTITMDQMAQVENLLLILKNLEMHLDQVSKSGINSRFEQSIFHLIKALAKKGESANNVQKNLVRLGYNYHLQHKEHLAIFPLLEPKLILNNAAALAINNYICDDYESRTSLSFTEKLNICLCPIAVLLAILYIGMYYFNLPGSQYLLVIFSVVACYLIFLVCENLYLVNASMQEANKYKYDPQFWANISPAPSAAQLYTVYQELNVSFFTVTQQPLAQTSELQTTQFSQTIRQASISQPKSTTNKNKNTRYTNAKTR